MSYAARKPLIEKLEKARGGTHVITYITSTRVGLENEISMDSIRKIQRHLAGITSTRDETKVDLFLHTNGGDGTVPWRLVTLIREYCSEFNVLIPYKAFSAGTLTALGADHIYMHRMGMLGPVDPTVTNAFNPTDPQTNAKLGISVEDVISYISLIREDVGITHEDELVKAWNQLTDQNRVHPLALGNVKRFYAQSRMMTLKLLELHMDSKDDAHKINEITSNLNSKLYFHGHPINRDEAKQLDLKVESADSKLEKAMWELYESYETDMKLEEPFNVNLELRAKHKTLNPLGQSGRGQEVSLTGLEICEIESSLGSDILEVDLNIEGYRAAPNGFVADQVLTNITRQEWKRV